MRKATAALGMILLLFVVATSSRTWKRHDVSRKIEAVGWTEEQVCAVLQDPTSMDPNTRAEWRMTTIVGPDESFATGEVHCAPGA